MNTKEIANYINEQKDKDGVVVVSTVALGASALVSAILLKRMISGWIRKKQFDTL